MIGIKVLVVDDSALVRQSFKEMLEKDQGIRSVVTANDGDDALRKIKEVGPDVIVIDLELPGMAENRLLKRIIQEWPLPVILFSERTKQASNRVFEAMRDGAIDFIEKPGEGILGIAERLVGRIKAAALARIQHYRPAKAVEHTFLPTMKKIVVIATSTGGPPTLERLLTELPKNTPAPLLIVQHMPAVFTKTLAERLDEICAITVREAKEGDRLEEGVVLIAPGGRHMEVVVPEGESDPVIALNDDPPELGVRPNANRLFRSVAALFGDRTIGLVLTGMGRDGTAGAGAIKAAHGTIIAQDEASSVIYGMPKEVVQAGFVDEVVPIDRMAVALVQLLDL